MTQTPRPSTSTDPIEQPSIDDEPPVFEGPKAAEQPHASHDSAAEQPQEVGQFNVTTDELKAILNLAIGKKSVVVAYALWFFLGGLGAHRFYLGKTTSAIIMLALTVLGALTSVLGIGLLMLIAVGIWWMIDAVLIFLAAQKANSAVDRAIDKI